MADTFCRHCGKRIRLVDFIFGPRWMHQPAEAAFQDGMYEYCHLTRAEHSTEDE